MRDNFSLQNAGCYVQRWCFKD